MKNCLHLLQVVGIAWLSVVTLSAQVSLRIERMDPTGLRLAWSNSPTPFLLEQTTGANFPSGWTTAPQEPTLTGDQFSVTVTAINGGRFFRLSERPLTRISSTSPYIGESGVGPTRETIIHFSAPLAPDTFLNTTHLYASFGGRRILSRVELAESRDRVTLFYLEPLPPSARVRVTFNPILLLDQWNRLVDVDGDGEPGGTALIDFDTLATMPLADTAVAGTVFASEPAPGTTTTNFINQPLAGVTITVDGAEESLRAVTDTDGKFLLQPAPAGDFFVHIDGRTLTDLAAGIRYPDMDYYPFVGKMWHADAGKTNLAAGTGLIYLPLIRTNTLQAVSVMQETTITFPPSVLASNPALAGVHITVPPNSLFSDNGSRGGMVGIAPVAPDRLPGPLPPGLEFPLVITVQSDGGENFDRPVPARFPNLPDPRAGQLLPPGAKSALWSFNHDKGLWELQGSMTVTADGLFVESDPGVGIRAPGWHGAFPGCSGGGGDGFGCPSSENCSFTCNTEGQAAPLTAAVTASSASCEPNGPMCQCRQPVEVNFFAGPIIFETQYDGGASAALFHWSMPTVETELCRDGNCYTLKVTSAENPTSIVLYRDGFRIPQPFDGGNITRENYCEVLGQMGANGGANCQSGWFTMEALEAHEQAHFEEHRNFINVTWPAVRADIEGICVRCKGTDEETARAILEAEKKAVLNKWQEKVNEYQRIKEENHKNCLCDLPFLRADEALRPVAEQVQAYGVSKGWGTFENCPPRLSRCRFPPLPPDPAPFQPAAIPALFRRLHASVTPAIVNPGEAAQFRAWAEYSDNTLVEVTLSATLRSMDTNRAVITAQGVVHSLDSGRILLRAEFYPEFGIGPISASVEFAIRDPLDQDLDLMPNAFEEAHGLNPADPADADADNDSDGLTNVEELHRGTDPFRTDSDGDGVPDGEELIQGRDPLLPGDAAPDPETGMFYYVIMNLDRLEIVQSGLAGKDDASYRQIILAPNTHYREWLVSQRTGHIGTANVTTPDAGTQFRFPGIHLRPSREVDSDGDALADDVEFVVGTDRLNADSDGDGIRDGAEFFQGTDPLDNRPVRTGLIANVKTPGPALDVYAVNKLVVVAEGNNGVAVFKAEPGRNPIITAQVDTPGFASRIACDGNYVAVADGVAGLAVIDITDPPAARIIHQLKLGSPVNAVALNGNIAYAGLEGGQVATVDLLNGVVLDRKNISGPVRDLGLRREFLYALVGGPPFNDQLVSMPLIGGLPLTTNTTVNSPFYVLGGIRLFVGGDLAYVTHSKGYNTFSLTNPALPAILATTNTAQFGWKQIVPNGSGLALAADGPNSTLENPADHSVSLYDVSNPTALNVFLTRFPTPGFARAISIYNGLAYVADDTNGMEIINYRAYDALGVPPLITLEHSAPPIGIEEGKPLRLTASVSDDVQVRNVEFYVDGRRVNIDGNYPFEYRLPAPRPALGNANIAVQALATDTGGNTNWSTILTIHVAPDLTPPALVSTTPGDEGYWLNTQPALYLAHFNELLDTATVTPANVRVTRSGSDTFHGTPDDVTVVGTLAWREEFNAITFLGAAPFFPDRYELTLSSNLTDLSGNHLPTTIKLHFRVLTNYLIAYSVVGSPQGTNWFMTSDGTYDQPFNVGERPRMSSAGRYVAFRRGAHPDVELRPIWVADLREGVERQIRSSGGQIHNTDWMPDSARVVFDSGGVFAMDLFGGNVTQVGRVNFASEGWPTVNPVDRSFVVHYEQTVPPLSFFRYIEPNGTNSYTIPGIGGTAPYYDMCPSWAPDGQNIAFLRGKFAEPNPQFSGPNTYRGDIFTDRRDGSALTQLTFFGLNSTHYLSPALVWTPDGQSILTAGFISNEFGIYRVDAGGSGTITKLKGSSAPITYVGSAVAAVPDPVPPRLLASSPADGQAVLSTMATTVSVVFNEAFDPGSLGTDGVRLLAAGDDDVFGNENDFVVAGTLSYVAGATNITFIPDQPLASGYYRIVLAPALADVAGNRIGTLSTPTFRVLTGYLIAYSVFGSPNGTNWIRTSDGTYDHPITGGDWPRLSRDGRYLAFHRGSHATLARRNIWMRDLQTGVESLLFDTTNNFAVNFFWTADSARLVFDYDCNIYRIDRSGANFAPFLQGFSHCADDWPVLSPTDQRLAFHNLSINPQGIYTANSNGTGRDQVPNTTVNDAYPSWSPDGQWIAYLRFWATGPETSRGNYWKIRPNGSGCTQLTSFTSGGTNYLGAAGAWTPEGDGVITAGYIGGQYGIYRVPADGSGTNEANIGVIKTSAAAQINYLGSVVVAPPP